MRLDADLTSIEARRYFDCAENLQDGDKVEFEFAGADAKYASKSISIIAQFQVNSGNDYFDLFFQYREDVRNRMRSTKRGRCA